MIKRGKNYKEFAKKIDNKVYKSIEAFSIITENAKAKESVDIVFVLNTNARKSDEVVKGIVPKMPSGLGKTVTIGVLSKKDPKKIVEMGANQAGFEDFIQDIRDEKVDYDVYIATRDVMPELAKMGMGRVLKGKMPNPKLGTVVEEADLAKAIEEQKGGQLNFRSNNSLIHTSIGRASFTKEQLEANFIELFNAVVAAKPQSVKPIGYIKKIFLSSTMGPSLQIEHTR